jgi:hypothetical protein
MELVRLIGQMLEKRREDRPPTYRDITERLVSVLRSGAAPGDLHPRQPESGDADGEPGAIPRGPTAPTQLVAGRASSISAPARRTAGIVLAAAFLLGLLLWGALTRKPGTDEVPPKTIAAVPRRVPATAELRITSVPWAAVVSVVDVKSGTAVPLPSPSETPIVLPVPPGRYRITLAEPPPGSARAEREVDAAAGVPALVAFSLRPIEELVETLR